MRLEPPGVRAELGVLAIRTAGVVTLPMAHRGLWYAARSIGRWQSYDQACVVALGESGQFRFGLGDPYWSRLVCRSFVYEPDVLAVLKRAAALEFSFYDLGANYGYWSVLCSDPAIGAAQVVAIEASPSTFGRLENNRALNGDRFTALHRAIYSETGRTVYINEDLPRHGARHVDSVVRPGCDVVTITIDDLLAAYPPVGHAIIKIDLEGAEVRAFEGAARSLEQDVVMIYEDHYTDRDCRPTAWLLANTDREIYHPGAGKRVTSLDEVKALKAHRRHDFIALAPGSAFKSLAAGVVG